MKKSAVLILTAAATALAGCPTPSTPRDGGTNTDGGGQTCSATTGTSYKFIVERLQVPNGMGSPIVGFNVDGNTADECPIELSEGQNNPHEVTGIAPGDLTGVDASLNNAFGTFSPNIDASSRDGTVMILAEVSGVDNLTNDPCVDISLLLGTFPTRSNVNPSINGPRVTGGRIDPDQMFGVDPLSYVGGTPAGGARIKFRSAQIVNGQLRTTSRTSDLMLSLAVNGSLVEFTIKNAQIRADISASGLTNGALGGGVAIDDLERTLCGPRDVSNPDVRGSGCCSASQRMMDGCTSQAGASGSGMMWVCTAGGSRCMDDAILPAMLTPMTAINLVAPSLDLNPDVSGECQHASIGMTFAATTARF